MAGVIHVMVGLPGSGKSTFARDLRKAAGNIVRVNRDELRAMLHGSRWSPANEKVTSRVEKEIVRAALEKDRSVVVDDCHVLGSGPAKWKTWAEEWNAKVEIHEMDISLNDCIVRDAGRANDHRVGRGVIERMALFGGMINLNVGRPVAIVDIDGTIADLTHRLHYINPQDGGKKNYDAFFASVGSDTAYPRVSAMVRALAKTHFVILLSGRPASTGFDTAQWLHMHNIPYQHLFMRQTGDHRPDYEIKEEIFNAMVDKGGLDKGNIDIVLDDRPVVVALWNRLELPLVQVKDDAVIRICNAKPSDLPQPDGRSIVSGAQE